jgi:hypothetical protein
MQNFDHNIGFFEKRQLFRRKLSKMAENCDHNIDPWDRCYNFLNIFAEKIGENNCFLPKPLLVFVKNYDHNMVFEKNANFVRRTWANREENCDHNIDPRLGAYSPIGRLFAFGHFFLFSG